MQNWPLTTSAISVSTEGCGESTSHFTSRVENLLQTHLTHSLFANSNSFLVNRHDFQGERSHILTVTQSSTRQIKHFRASVLVQSPTRAHDLQKTCKAQN